MFFEYFGLIEQPFGVTPDPRFLHLGPNHREALASLVYGTESNRGFLALIAQPGMGKTSLLYQYLEWLRDKARTAFLFHTDGDSGEFMRHLLLDLGIESEGKDLAAMRAALNQVLMEEMRAGRRFVLVIDEAQNLDERVLESIRLLSNFETPWMKLMHIVIAGQPQLALRLARPSMAQLRQRISSVIRLAPFTPEETNAYVDHRLWVAGYSGPPLFTVGARLSIAELSHGIPRNINNLCFNCMSVAYALGAKQIDAKMVAEVVSDFELDSLLPSQSPPVVAPSNSRVFSPFSAPFSSMAAPRLVHTEKRRRAWRMIPAIASAAAVLFLGIASGMAWNRGMRTPPLDFLPSPEAAGPPVNDAQLVRPAPAAIIPTSHRNPADREETLPAIPDQGHPVKPVITVVVQKQATLRDLSLQYLRRFDEAALVEIFALNPQIRDSDHIEAGQRLRLPMYLRRETLEGTKTAARIAPATQEGERP
jgi:general secretion pathway protein A